MEEEYVMASSEEKSSEEDTERDGAPSGASHVGALLQASRQRLGEELSDVALMLRIRLPYLAAIEAGRYRELPGATYAVGFIRAYAEHLGLDSEEVVRRFKVETIDGGSDQKLSFPTPVPETGIPGGAYVFVGLVIAVIAYGAWYVSTTKDGFFAELISPLDEQISSLLTSEDNAAGPSDTEGNTSGSNDDDAAVAKPDDAKSSEEVSEAPVSTEANPADAMIPATGAENAPTSQPETPAAAPLADAAAELGPAVGDVEPTSTEPQTTPVPNTPTTSGAPAETSEVTPADTTNGSATETTQQPVSDASSEPAVVDTPPAPIVEAETSSAEPEAVVNEQPENQPAAVSVTQAPAEPAPAVEPTTSVEIIELPEPPIVTAQTETDAAPVLSASGTESEIATTELPVVPTRSEPEPEAVEVAASDVPSQTVSENTTRIIINAKNNSWIQVRDDVANQMLVTRLLTAGDSYEVPNRSGLVLLTGNAGALEILVDGVAAPSIGGNGVVRRGVVLEVERLKQGTAVTN